MNEQLFHFTPDGVTELPSNSQSIKPKMKKMLDEHLESYLGVRFVTSGYSTGKKHGGHIDVLGLDENNCPVVIQHRHEDTDSIMEQGMDLVAWMISNQHRINALVVKKWGSKVASTIAWRNPRLICISENFYNDEIRGLKTFNMPEGRYTADFFRYNRFGADNLAIEWFSHLGHDESGSSAEESTFVLDHTDGSSTLLKPLKVKSAQASLEKCSPELQGCFQAIYDYLAELGNQIEFSTFDLFFAFKHIKNFVRIVPEPRTNTLWMYVKLDPSTVDLEAGFTRDVTTKAHLATGHLEIAIRNQADLEKAKPLLLRAYQQS